MANIDTTHLESGSAQRSAARPALLEGIQRINAMTDLTGSGYGMQHIGGRLERVRSGGMFNLHPGKLSRIRAALARHRAGVGTAKIAFVGDSTTAGVGSNPAGANADIRRRAYPAVLAQIIKDRFGLKTTAMSFWGDGWETAANLETADPRLDGLGPGGWSVYTTMVPGGHALRDTTTTSPPLTFTPSTTIATDALDIFVVTYPGYGDLVVSTGGIYNGGGSSNGPAGIKKYTATRPLSTAPWVLQKSTATSSAELIVIGAQARVSADNAVEIWNMGAAGSKVQDWAAPNEPWNARNAIAHPDIRPHLVSVGLTINDWAALTSETTYKNGLAAIVEPWLVYSDVLLQIGVPSNIGTATIARQEQVTQWALDIAMQYDAPAVVWPDRWVSQSYDPMRGLYYDGLHPSNVGYQDIAEVLARVICEV